MNDGEKTTRRLYAWIAEDLDGIEGIIAYPMFNALTPMPLVATDRSLAEQFAPLARQAAAERKSVARLVIFERGETIDSVEP
jgi:hypothetical protein